MRSMNLIWSCTPGPLVHGAFGGYSDRLKGIVTGYLLAKRLHRQFWIEWQGLTCLGDFFNISCDAQFEQKGAGAINTVDKLSDRDQVEFLLQYLQSMNADNIWLTANQYMQAHWNVLCGQGTMESTFADVLEELLQPKPGLLEHPSYQYLASRMQNRIVVGLQIRMGDQAWDRPNTFKVPSEEVILRAVRSQRAEAVLVVSDSPEWKRNISSLITDREVIMLDYATANPDRSPAEQSQKAFPLFLIEHFLLSQCCAVITGDGGGGRTAAWWGRKPLIELVQAQ